MDTKISLFTQNDQWDLHPEINLQLVEKILKQVLNILTTPQFFNFVEVSIFLSNNNHIKFLNKRYLNKNKSTNVLAFPKLILNYKSLSLTSLECNNRKINLGDVILSYKVLLAESRKFSIPLLKHFTHLLIHGFLHLLGFDHVKGEDARIMEETERKILAKILI